MTHLCGRPIFVSGVVRLLLLLAASILRARSFTAVQQRGKHPYKTEKPLHSDESDFFSENHVYNTPSERPPIPVMPSEMFRRMAHSQLELLANSLTAPGETAQSKVESMALYLPQENVNNGQLEFTPAVLYPDPTSERVFIASDAASALTLPPSLTKLPGFAHATTLLPGYPMMSSDEVNPGVGIVEEVMCDARFKNKAAALSVPLLSGSQTVGVLLVSPALSLNPEQELMWSDMDRDQVSRAAQSLSMALSMDNERNFLREQNNAFRENLSDSLHQMKNPIQALRTYGKILQRQIANTDDIGTGTPQLLELTERLMIQSERVVDLMVPMDMLLEDLEHSTRRALQPAKMEDFSNTLVFRPDSSVPLPWEQETLDFARTNGEKYSDPGIPTVEETPTREDFFSDPNMTQVSRAQTTSVGDSNFEMAFVSDVLEPIISAYQAIAMENGIRFEVVDHGSELPGVLASPKSLQEAISNVLDNALKYVDLPKEGSPFTKNPSPFVRLRLLSNIENPGVTILVEDNGPGIKPSDRQKVFGRGYRGEHTKIIGGSGIGLDIAQGLVHRMGGMLSIAEDGEFNNILDGTIVKCELYRDPRQKTKMKENIDTEF